MVLESNNTIVLYSNDFNGKGDRYIYSKKFSDDDYSLINQCNSFYNKPDETLEEVVSALKQSPPQIIWS